MIPGVITLIQKSGNSAIVNNDPAAWGIALVDIARHIAKPRCVWMKERL